MYNQTKHIDTIRATGFCEFFKSHRHADNVDPGLGFDK